MTGLPCTHFVRPRNDNESVVSFWAFRLRLSEELNNFASLNMMLRVLAMTVSPRNIVYHFARSFLARIGNAKS